MAVEMVFYFRQCRGSNLIKDFATFHFYFPYDHMPNSTILTQMDLSSYQANCASPCKLTNFSFVSFTYMIVLIKNFLSVIFTHFNFIIILFKASVWKMFCFNF